MNEDDLINSLVGEIDLVGHGRYDRDVGYWDDVGAEDPEIRELLDMVNGDELIGAEELIGAAVKRAVAKKNGNGGGRMMALRRALARAQVERGVSAATGRSIVAAPTQPTKGRVLMIGNSATQGAVAGLLTISQTAQEMCRIDRLFVTAIDGVGAIIPNSQFVVADIRVGVRSQLAAIGSLPGIMFQADATSQGSGLSLDTVQAGTQFSVQIANAPAASVFTWGAYATALR